MSGPTDSPRESGMLRRMPAALQDLLATRDSHLNEWLEGAPTRTQAFASDDTQAHPLPFPAARTDSLLTPSTIGSLWRRRNKSATAGTLEQRSLFGEILDWMFAPMLLLWPLSVVITFILARSLADVPFDRALIERTDALARQAALASTRSDVTLPRAPEDFVTGDDDDVVYFQVIGPRSKLLIGQVDLPPPRLYDYPEPGRIKLRTATYRGSDVRIGYVYVDDGQADDGAPVLVQVAETLDKRTRLANEIIKGVIFPQFMILPVAVTLVWFGLSRGLAPLKSLQRLIRNRSPDDLSPIDPRLAPEEIAPLIDAFNDQLDRLRGNIEGQKRFIAAAAHQMKTPLAGVRMQTELALRERDPAQLRRSLELIALSSQRASHVVSQLLALARTETQRTGMQRIPMDINTLARDIVSDWVPMSITRQIDLGYETNADQSDGRRPEQPLRIDGNALLLRELLNNLIDNALRFTPAGGTVTVSIRRSRDTVLLEVDDTGPGVPAHERELVFDRFYRVLGTDVDGSGLGLAIVREIAEQHDAVVSVNDTHPGQQPPGARFTVRFAASGTRDPAANQAVTDLG